MISNLAVKDFAGVAHLESSALMQLHKGKLKFSATRPNVIVGPNGSGKSALLDSLSLRFLAHQTGESSLDEKYVLGHDCKALWSEGPGWRREFTFLKGLQCETDNGAVLYYRPNHIPGNDHSVTAAMMCGYFDEARAYDKAVKNKSSGQANQALLEKILTTLSGAELPQSYRYTNWRFGKEPRDLRARESYVCNFDYQAEVLKAQFATPGTPLILMDEPEQSLDALAAVKLWQAIAAVDCTKMQVIVATHSLYPLLHPEAFNLIETQRGYARQVLSLLK